MEYRQPQRGPQKSQLAKQGYSSAVLRSGNRELEAAGRNDRNAVRPVYALYVDRLDTQLQELHARLGDLRSRLAPVLSSGTRPDVPPATSKHPIPDCSVANVLHEALCRVETLNQAVSEIQNDLRI